MTIYFDVAWFYFLRYLTYPLEMAAIALRRLIEVGLILVFWAAVAKSSTTPLDYRSLIAYFLIAGALNDLVMAQRTRFGQFLIKGIKTGKITQYIIKPISLVPYLYSAAAGQYGMTYFVAIIGLIAGLIVRPPASPLGVLLFMVATMLAIIIALYVNLFCGVLAFWTTEANSFRNVLAHVIKFLSGVYVPLYFFPEPLRTMVTYSPFPSMIYTPAHLLNFTSFTPEAIQLLAISVGWAIGSAIIVSALWKHGLKYYEAVGI